MPRVSVIIPTYNREEYVAKAIDSALGQIYKDYEIIVVDDGSSDNTQRKLKIYANKINYIYQHNSGVSAARNTGIKHAEGEWLAFLDSDDEWKPEYLLKQIEKVDSNRHICMQTTDCLFIESNGHLRRYFEINGSLAEFHGRDYFYINKPFRFVVRHGPWQIGSTIIRKNVIQMAGLFDPSLTISEDFDLMARVALQGPFGMIREALINVFRRHEKSKCLTQKAKDDPIKSREINEEIYKKLKTIQTLERNEIKALNYLLSANRRAIGNLLAINGKKKDARDCYKQALIIAPSIASLGKYVLSYLPVKMIF